MKTYTKPEIVVTSYEADNAIMLKSGIVQSGTAINTNNYSTIDF